DGPLVGWRSRDRLLDALEGAYPPRERGLPNNQSFSAHRVERQVHEIERHCFDLESVGCSSLKPAPEQSAQHHGIGRKQPMRCNAIHLVGYIELFRRKILVKAECQRPIPDCSWKA